MFATIEEHVDDMLAASANPKVFADRGGAMDGGLRGGGERRHSTRRGAKTDHARSPPAFRRIEADVLIQIGLGRFFAAKLRSGVLYAVFEQSEEPQAGRKAIDQYEMAREAWAGMATHAAARFIASDISYGSIADATRALERPAERDRQGH